jgi:tetratricopeptide (TPR) repeat protein
MLQRPRPIPRKPPPRAAKLYDHYRNPPASPALAASPLMRAAQDAIRASRREAEIETTRALIAAFPHEPEARVLRAVALLDYGWEPGAGSPERHAFEQSLEDVRLTDPLNPWDEVLHGLMLARDGQVRGGVEQLSRVLEREDLASATRGAVLAMRGQAYRDLGQLTRALSDLRDGARLDPTYEITLVMLSDALAVAGRAEEALDAARRAVALAPEQPDCNFVLAWNLARAGRWHEALRPIEQASKVRRVQNYAAFHALALLHDGSPQQARDVAARARALPESDWGCYYLARYEAALGHRRRALEHLRRSLALGYLDPEAPLQPEFARYLDDPEFGRTFAELRERLRRRDALIALGR